MKPEEGKLYNCIFDKVRRAAKTEDGGEYRWKLENPDDPTDLYWVRGDGTFSAPTRVALSEMEESKCLL